ncbi:AAA family ATPase [Streptomyces sp. NPDC005336]|uniref:AAA family ATPase n=1 Tax=Streptomyces sp. NPDC005336 TaxID=3157035 RepID=UPI0033B143ED
MYVTKIGLSNIRGFTGPRTVNLALPEGGGWIVMAGRSGSGKTTLLKALAVALGGPSVARTLVSDFSGWVSQGSGRAGRRRTSPATRRLTCSAAGGGRRTGRRFSG